MVSKYHIDFLSLAKHMNFKLSTRSYFIYWFSFILTFVCVATSDAQSPKSVSSTETIYTEGLELLDKNNFAAARQAFSRYLLLAPNDQMMRINAEYYRAYAALRLFNNDGEKLIEDFIQDYNNHPKAALAYFELGDFYLRDKSFKKASDYFSKVRLSLLDSEKRNETKFKLGYSLFAQQEFDEALNLFNALKKGNSDYAAASSYYAGYIELEKELYDVAIEDLRRAEKNDSYKRVVPTMLADLYYKQGNYEELLTYSEKVLSSDVRVNQRDFYLLAAEAHSKKENYEQAINYYEKYLDGFNNPPKDVTYRIGYSYFKNGEIEKAIDNLKTAATLNNETGTYASYYLGISYLKQGNKLYAITAFDNVKRSEVDQKIIEESHYQYVKINYDLNRTEEAIESARSYLENYPNGKHEEEIGDLLSSAYLDSDNYNLAIDYLEGRSALNSRQQIVYQKATYLKGMELFNKGEYENALLFFDKSLKYSREEDFELLAAYWAGETYSLGSKYEQSKTYYKRALNTQADPKIQTKVNANYGLGYAYFNTKFYTDASKYFKRYLDLASEENSYYTDALLRYADCQYVAKDYSLALKYYQQAIKNQSSDSDYARLQAGIIYGIKGELKPGVDQFDVIINRYTDSRYLDDALFQKAQLYFEKGRYEKAADGFTKLIENKSSSPFVPYAYMRRASSNYNLKEYDKTITDYEAVIDKFPTHSAAEEALLPLQEALTIQNRSAEFDRYLAKYKTANPAKRGLENVEFETAKNHYYSLNYTKSIDAFESFISDYPNSAQKAEAKYFIAESYYRLEKTEKALQYYNELLASGNYSPISKVINRIGELEYGNGRYENAIYFYNKLIKEARTKKEQYYAWSGLMESFYNIKNYDSARHYARVILERGNVNVSSQNKASLYLGKVAYAKANYELAEDEFLNTLNTAKDIYGAEAQYLLGKLYYDQNKYEKSIEILIELNNAFNIYKRWVGESYLLLAENYMALDDVFQAKGTLQSVIDNFPLESIKSRARDKLKVIERNENEDENNQTDTLIFDN